MNAEKLTGDQLKDVFFQLLRIGLWNNGALITKSPLTAEDWSKIYSIAINHTLDGLIYDSFAFLTPEQLPPSTLRMKWAIRIDQIERHNALMNTVIANQYKDFCEQGLSPILQKGQGVAQYYITPEHRICGDIDWYFEDRGYKQARNFLKKKSITINDTAGFSLDYDWKGIHIEHHKLLFDVRNPLKSGYLNKIQKVYKEKQQTLAIQEVPVKLLAPELQLLQVNSHIFKHLITFGIGLRQFCDSARLYHKTASQVDQQSLKKIYQDAGILGWTHLLHLLLVKYLGLPQADLPFPYPTDLDADWMLDEIWYSGNFGFHDERFEQGKVKSQISLRPEGTRRLWSNFMRYFKYAPQEVLFFPFVQLYSRITSKHPD